MYAEYNQSVFVGLPGQRCDEEGRSSTMTTIGGQALLHSRDHAPQSLQCPRCSLSSMVLVMQLFAPVTHLERSLYVYACANEACNSTSAGWRVFRNQQFEDLQSPAIVETTGSTGKVKATTPAVSAKAIVAAPAPVVSKKTEKKKAPATNWQFDDAEDDADLDDLEQMLAARDNTLITPPPAPQQSAPSRNTAPAVPAPIAPSTTATAASTTQPATDRILIPTTLALPCYRVNDVEEDWDRTYDHSEEDEVPPGHADTHTQALLRKYLSEEEDQDHVVQLQQLGIHQRTQTQSHIPDDNNNDAEDEDNIGDDDDEEGRPAFASSSSFRYKSERYLQRRLRQHPTQVLRYAYGGTPLWITNSTSTATTARGGARNRQRPTKPASTSTARTAFPATSAVRACEHCGAPREFECQLMPALLSVWPQCSSLPTQRRPTTTSNTTSNTTSAVALDFGTVAIWTCSRDCQPPQDQVAYEVIEVLPPIDQI